MDNNYLYDGFINEALPALDRHAGGGGGSIPETIILVDQDGNECAAVLTNDEVELDATPNDIREGMTAVTDLGVTTGEKFIPAYHTTEGIHTIRPGQSFTISSLKTLDAYKYTKLQVIICEFNKSLVDSTAAVKVSINNKVYNVMSNTMISEVIIDDVNKIVDMGITNDSDSIFILRYFTYKEVI